ncbi:hypothetical protein [Sphingopyxis sp. PET50]|uniref:hypothetical protein n=1 Tax=Sphingopyxis sp. PET50 TaxID=2976533 RepID=UPI0021AEDE28|nr:hypothetical protein [Sphingopyxis sp. PET50]
MPSSRTRWCRSRPGAGCSGASCASPDPSGSSIPLGTPLDPRYCLPAAYAPFVLAPEGQRWRRVGGYVQACLADRDGDGLYEALNLFAGDSAMHVPVRHLERSETLAVPQALAEDPLGLADSRRYVHRRVTVTVKDNIARLAIAHAFQDQDRHAAPGVYVTGSDGAYVYRLVPRPPHPVSMTGNSYFGSGRDAEASVTIADGAEVAVGGLAFRIDHYSHGFTLQPLASRSPRWVHYGCGGTSILLGPAPKTPLDSAPAPR